MSMADPSDNHLRLEQSLPLIDGDEVIEEPSETPIRRRKTERTQERKASDGVDGYRPSSEDNAGFISALLFTFVGSYWWRTRNAESDEDFLEKPPKRITAQYAASRLEKAWKENGEFKRHFLVGVYHATKWNVAVYAITLCLEELARVAQPLLLRSLMGYYDTSEYDEFPFWAAMTVAGLISLLSFITVFIHHPYFHGLLKVGNNTRVGTGVLLYKKALRLHLTSLSETNSGNLIQLLNTDAAKLEQAFLFVHYVWLCPFLSIFYAFILWYCFGFSCLTGFLVMMVFVAAQVYFSYQMGVIRRELGQKMDARLKTMSEIINGIKVIKMHGWEHAFAEKIKALRDDEMRSVRKSAFCSAMVLGVYFVSAKIGLLVYIVSCRHNGEDLTTNGVFTASALYNSVRLPFALFLPLGLLFGRELISTSRRMNFFFRLNEFTRNSEKTVSDRDDVKIKETDVDGTEPTWNISNMKTEDPYINLKNVTAVWFGTLEENEKKQRKELDTLNGENQENNNKSNEGGEPSVIYAIREVSIEFKAGQCYGIVGSVGSGKSSFLLTVLSESRMIKGHKEMHGTVAYCSQEPWIFTGTIRENILFDSEFDRDRYDSALEWCLLKKDLAQLPNGDSTIVGDNGSTISGGQRARVALARAVYSDADIYLLDDPLSAVDSQVGKSIYENLIRKFLSKKLVILVTHQIHFLKDLSTVIFMRDNFVADVDSLENLKTNFKDDFSSLQLDLPEYSELFDEKSSTPATHWDRPPQIDSSDEEPMNYEDAISRMPKEARKKGMIAWNVYWKYTKEVFRPVQSGVFLLFLIIGTQFLSNFLDWWLNKWLAGLDVWRAHTNATDPSLFDHDISLFGIHFDVTFEEYKNIFYVSSIALTFLGVVRAVWFRREQLSASQKLHNNMFDCVLFTQSDFFDTNSEGAILNRFSKDIGQTDDMLAFTYFEFIFGALAFFGIVALVVMVRPAVTFGCVPITLGFYFCRKFYVARSRELKRIEAIARSPLNTLITNTIHGLATIRAYQKENEMIEKFCKLHDNYMAAYNMGSLSTRWFGICIDFLVSVFVSTVAFVVVIQYESLTVGEVGLCLVCAVQLSGFFSWIMRQSAELENGMVSVERLLEYAKLQSEENHRKHQKKYIDAELGRSWPTKGVIEFDDVSVMYGEAVVLKKLTFVVLGGQKIGVVGRTGAGKSTLIRILFGLKEYASGSIRIDGVDLNEISLKFRRSGMAIIPQEPTIFSGTVRENLDPFDKYEDSVIWQALEQCELKNVITKEKGLYVELGHRGVSLSVGQRQLFCLARAMIHKSKILIIDEATANVDGKTDALLQTTIRNFFEHSTIITVAHRLHTVMNSDRIMVFEEGCLKEFEKPLTLLEDTTSVFAKMAAHTGPENFKALKRAAEEYAIHDRLPYRENP